MADADKWACRGGKIVGSNRGTAKNSYLPYTYKHEKPARWRCSPVSNRPSHHLATRGSDREHARAPFSAVRASWKLKVDGFSSPRGAFHDPHHEKTIKATTSPRPLGGDRWKPAPRCIFHHFCKCDTNLGGTPRLNFRFYRFLNFWRAFFITFASVTPIPVRRRTKIFVFIIFNQNFECRPSPHTHIE